MMAVLDFSIHEAETVAGFKMESREDLFSPVELISPSEWLSKTLLENSILLVDANATERSLAEFVVAPMLLELHRYEPHLGILSGCEFELGDGDELVMGESDFLVTKYFERYCLVAPILLIVEIKKGCLAEGVAQCGATVVIAQKWNAKKGQGDVPVFGVVTTGEEWKFLKLENSKIMSDKHNFYIRRELPQIFSILASIVKS
jgi:hypothetical protein